MRKLRLLSLCSGIGVIDYVWSYILGQEIAGQIEIDPYCTDILAERFQHVPRYSDIKEVAADGQEYINVGDIDLMAGGIPCQPFSSAGKRRGTQDDRHLWPYALALVKRYRPRWVLIENVAGLVHMALDLIQTDLESEGYATQAFVLPACAVGAPHERQRVFIVAYTTSCRSQVSAQTPQHADQSDPSDPLAHSSGTRWETAGAWQCADASLQCSEALAHAQGTECQRSGAPWSGRAGSANSGEALAHTNGYQCNVQRQGVRADTEAIREDVAYTHSDRQRVRADKSQRGRECRCTPNFGTYGTQRDMAHANLPGLQIGEWCPGQAWAPTTIDGCTPGEPQSRLGRSTDGPSNWLDKAQWPASPGELQYAWEPSRTVTTKRDKYRARRLKALGNAIVPQQIYPFLYHIVEYEHRGGV